MAGNDSWLDPEVIWPSRYGRAKNVPVTGIARIVISWAAANTAAAVRGSVSSTP
jgi:hypothetical protein